MWSKSDTLTDYYQARVMEAKYPHIVENLEKWRMPYADAFLQSGITTSMLADGVHMGGGGYDYTTSAVEKYVSFVEGELLKRFN